ncbi:MAG: hypothetical protein JXA82_01750 [Sedimentisphaerales bacterium]|nr:hypothetical protein [Sedimentisphaerales bacterium]
MKGMIKKRIAITSLLVFFCVIYAADNSAEAQSYIIDHSCIDIRKIPPYWTEKAKELVLVHTGQSHGRQIPYGLQILAEENVRLGIDMTYDEIPPYSGRLRVSRGLRNSGNGWMTNIDTTDYWDGLEAIQNVRRTLQYHQSKGVRIDIILHTWSWDFREITENKINQYIDALETLQSEFPDTAFVYMSDTDDKAYDPFDENGHWGYNWLIRRSQIYNHVLQDERILFDFGELETWSADGSEQNGFVDWLYGIEVPLIHSDWLGDYDGGEGWCHINQAACVMKAKAMWWLLARIAGWDGCQAPPGDVTGDCRVDIQDMASMAANWLSDQGDENWNPVFDLRPDGGDGVIDIQDFSQLAMGWALDPYGSATIVSEPILQGTVGLDYNYDVEATGDPAPQYALDVYPVGMQIDGILGMITWLPAQSGSFEVLVRAFNDKGEDAQAFTLTVSEPTAPLISSLPTLQTEAGQLYSYDVQATGNPIPAYELMVGPVDMAIDIHTGRLTWMPTMIGDFDITVRASNLAGIDEQSFTLHVSPLPPSITSNPLLLASLGNMYVYDVMADGIPLPVYSLSKAPAGMDMDEVTGRIEWIPAAVGNFEVSIIATNQGGQDLQEYTISVSEVLFPQIENLVLSSTSGNGLTTDNLTCSFDLAGNAITAAVAWQKDGQPWMRAYMPFEGGSEIALLDFSGNGATSTPYGTPVFLPSGGYNGGGCFEFDGQNQLNTTIVFPTLSSYTKAAWIYRTGNDYNNILSGSQYSTGGHSFRANTDGRLMAGHPSGNWTIVQDGQPLENNVWYFAAVTYDYSTGTMILYKNGIEVDRAVAGASSRDVTDPGLLIGAIQGSFRWQGRIDDVRIYDYVLSTEQIMALYEQGGDMVVSQETNVGDQWNVHVIPFSIDQGGQSYLSNMITIQNP